MHAAKSSLPPVQLGNDYETRVAEWGGYMAYFERAAAGTDWTQHYETCECPHLGYVFRGKVRFVYRDGSEEVVSAGEMYYIRAGHTFEVLEDAETVEFSPMTEYKRHMQMVVLSAAGSREKR